MNDHDVVSGFSRTNRRTGWTNRPLVQLTLARMREFIREPEAVFWTFGFPIVMSLALAMAFPSRAGRAVVIGIAPGAAAADLRSTLMRAPGIAVREVPPEEERRQLRDGAVDLLVVP